MNRPVPRLSLHRAALLIAALTLTAGCSGGGATTGTGADSPSDTPSSTGSSTTTAPPPPPPPAVSGCHQLDFSAISHYTNSDPVVPCARSHTSYTFAVQTLPRDVNVPGASIGNKSIQSAASSGCESAFSRFIGGDPTRRALSRLSVTYFLPKQKYYDRGADWVRCDVVALQSADALAPLPQPLQGFLDDSRALQDYGVCSAGEPGAKTSALVICGQPHTFRALTALRLGTETSRYPGKAVAGTDGQKRCSTYIADALGTNSGYTYAWTYPTESDWASGQRFGFCWNKTTH